MRLPLGGLRNHSRIGRERNVSVVRFQLQKTHAFLNVPLILPRRSPAVQEADSLFLTITWTMLRLKKHNYKHNFFMNYKDKTQAKCLLTAITKTKHTQNSHRDKMSNYWLLHSSMPVLSSPKTGAVQETTLREDAGHPLISDYISSQE